MATRTGHEEQATVTPSAANMDVMAMPGTPPPTQAHVTDLEQALLKLLRWEYDSSPDSEVRRPAPSTFTS